MKAAVSRLSHLPAPATTCVLRACCAVLESCAMYLYRAALESKEVKRSAKHRSCTCACRRLTARANNKSPLIYISQVTALAFASFEIGNYNLSVVLVKYKFFSPFFVVFSSCYVIVTLTVGGRWRRPGVRTATDVSYRRDGGVFEWTEEEEGAR